MVVMMMMMCMMMRTFGGRRDFFSFVSCRSWGGPSKKGRQKRKKFFFVFDFFRRRRRKETKRFSFDIIIITRAQYHHRRHRRRRRRRRAGGLDDEPPGNARNQPPLGEREPRERERDFFVRLFSKKQKKREKNALFFAIWEFLMSKGERRGVAGAQPRRSGGETNGTSSASSNTFRWIVDIEQWHPIEEHDGREFQFLLNLIQQDEEREQVLKYYHFADKKRALMSRLMTRAACAKARECKFEEVIIGRTKGRKPFFQNVHEVVVDQPLLSPSTNGVSNNDSSISNDNMSTNEGRIGIANAPNFNFNVSHEGKYVVLVSEPYAICGVDVAAPDQLRLGNRSISTIDEIFETFDTSLHPSEKEQILKQNGLSSQLSRFRQIWSLKEAWSKCIGTGLGAKFASAAFTISQDIEAIKVYNDNDDDKDEENDAGCAWVATISVDDVNGDSQPDENWSFYLHPFPPLEDIYDVPDDKTHWITVARGPTNCVVDAHGEFWKTLKAKNIESKEQKDTWKRDIWRRAPAFEMLQVEDLVPEALRYRFRCLVKEEENCEKVLVSIASTSMK